MVTCWTPVSNLPVYVTEGRREEGQEQLRLADQLYNGYSMEGKLHFRIHRYVVSQK